MGLSRFRMWGMVSGSWSYTEFGLALVMGGFGVIFGGGCGTMGGMKILMLGWELPPHNSGGLGVACMHLSRALAGEGAEIDFVVPYEAEHEVEHMRVLAATKLDPLYRWGVTSYDSWRVEEALFREVGREEMLSIRDVQRHYCEFVERYLMEYKPDCVHAHDWLTYEAGMLAKRNYGLPLVAHVHATGDERGKSDNTCY